MSSLKAVHLLYTGDEKGGAQRVAVECAMYNKDLYTSTVKRGGLIKMLQQKSLRSLEFKKLIFNHKFDIVFCSDPRALIFSFLCLRSLFAKKYLILHSDKLIKHSSLIKLLCRVSFVHCVCTTQTQFEEFNSSAVSASLVRIVDIPIMKNPNKKSCNFLYFGRFEKIKNIQEIIDTFICVRENIHDLRLTIVGSGKDIPASAQGVDIIANWVSHDELVKIMEDNSFVVNATEYEGFSLQIMEGISNGLFPLVKSKELLLNYSLPEECKYNVENVFKLMFLGDSDWNKKIVKFQSSLNLYLQNTVHIKHYIKCEINS